MRRAIAALAGALSLLALQASPAGAAVGFSEAEVSFTDSEGATVTQAGSHPFEARSFVEFNLVEPEPGKLRPDEDVKDVIVEVPAGFAGTPTPVPRCSAADFLEVTELGTPSCKDASAVGHSSVVVFGPGGEETFRSAIYNLLPPPGVAAKLGFIAFNVPVTIEVGVNPDPPYNLIASFTNISQAEPIRSADTVLWGNPADPRHDAERGRCFATEAADKCSVSIPEKPFLTMPRRCSETLTMRFAMRSWQKPGTVVEEEVSFPGMSDCSRLPFGPEISSRATSDHASSPTGLDFGLDIDDEGLVNPSEEAFAHSDIKKASVALPEGVTVNPSIAAGLRTCSEGDLRDEEVDSAPGEGCPEASKVGEVEVETPLLEGELLRGQVFVASQGENPFDSLLALYMVIKDPGLGVLVKLAGRVEPDPDTGQLVTTFGEPGHEIPQFPFSRFRFHFREGGRSPLITPPRCGAHRTRAEFTPWANPSKTLVKTATFRIRRGVGGAPCPPSTPPFAPGFAAGSLNNAAAQHTPFFMRLTRRDGDQDITRFTATLPPGLVGKLAGIAWCPEAAIAAADSREGREELARPSCPAASRIGATLAGAGVGSQLTYVPGSLYLAGPYGGAPLSVVAITPAVAGPFDVGTVVVREALRVNPITAEVTADGALSDRIPHLLAGIPLKLRDLRVFVDRPQFVLNPSSCATKLTRAIVAGGGSFLRPAGDLPVFLSQRFQAAGCRGLGFKPRLGLRLKGGTRRGANPALRAVYVPRAGDANLRRLALTFPRSEFVDNANFRTICTRVQYAADACPPGAVYGRVKAWTPLLAEPLQGPVYLRSSDNLLPDAVFDLKGLIDAEVAVRIDSVKGRLRATVQSAPDVPVSRVVVQMQGGRKGLFINSRDICRGKNRARIRAAGQNNRRALLRPLLRPAGCKKQRRAGRGG